MGLAAFFFAMVITMTGTMISSVAVVPGTMAMFLMEFFRLLEIVALAGKTKHTKRQRDQENFHHAPSIATGRWNATPKGQKSRITGIWRSRGDKQADKLNVITHQLLETKSVQSRHPPIS